jgi:hypothetical protein
MEQGFSQKEWVSAWCVGIEPPKSLQIAWSLRLGSEIQLSGWYSVCSNLFPQNLLWESVSFWLHLQQVAVQSAFK